MLTTGLSIDFLNVLLCENVTHGSNPEDDSCPTGISARIEFGPAETNNPNRLPLKEVTLLRGGSIFGEANEFTGINGAIILVPEPTSLVLIAAALGLFFCGYQIKFVQRRR